MEDQKEMEDRELVEELLLSGDRPSIFFFGMVGAHAIRKDQMAVYMVDVLGRVHLMPPSAVKILHRPRLTDEELAQFTEEEAINLLIKQGDDEDSIVQYLSRRDTTREAL